MLEMTSFLIMVGITQVCSFEKMLEHALKIYALFSVIMTLQ